MQHRWKQLPPHLMSRWQLRKWHRSFRVRGTEGARTSVAEQRESEVGDDPIVGFAQVKSLETPPAGRGRAAGDNQHRILHELLQLIENIAMCVVSYQPPNWTDFFDVYTRDMGTQTQTDVLRTSAAEQGGMTAAGGERWVGRWEPLEQTPASFCSVKMDASVQTQREVPRVHLDPGGSSTMPTTCERKTDYTKLLLDCKAGSDRIHGALGRALSEFPGSTADKVRRHMILAYDEWEAVHAELARYRHRDRQDSFTQTEAPRSVRRSIPAEHTLSPRSQ